MRRYRNCYEPARNDPYPEWMYTTPKCVIYGPFVLAFVALMVFVGIMAFAAILAS